MQTFSKTIFELISILFFSDSEEKYQKISIVAHLSGAVAGLLVGIIVLKNRKVHTWEIKLKILCIITFAVFIGGCCFWNIAADPIMQRYMGKPFFENSQDYQDYESSCYFDRRYVNHLIRPQNVTLTHS